MKSKHEGVVYSCEYKMCNFKALAISHLKDHVNSKHLGISYFCEPCQMKLGRNGDLTKHKRTQRHKQIFQDLNLPID